MVDIQDLRPTFIPVQAGRKDVTYFYEFPPFTGGQG
jgi:hypothetical protein